jgi:hypothetical protein
MIPPDPKNKKKIGFTVKEKQKVYGKGKNKGNQLKKKKQRI